MSTLPSATPPPVGAILVSASRCLFRVWAPFLNQVEVHLVAPRDQRIPLQKVADGYHEAVIDDCPAGTRYLFVLNGGNERPDPASRLQPEGVHGPSEVVGSEFEWSDRNWNGIALEDHVVYELHVGTFTEEGTFEAIIPHLDGLKDLGVTAVELLPVAQFPGSRNWGYDGTYVNAAQNSYGGPLALKRLVDAAHASGLAVLLDVVYNHLGPEGNYLAEYGPYFTHRYRTPWGMALNFDGAHSDHVRWYFIQNALQWIDEFHIDGLRVDAVHAIVDHSAEPFLQDLNAAVEARAEQLGCRVWMIAESDLNDPRVFTPKEQLGLGFHTQWADDYHHSLHALLTGEQDGYYQGFGSVSGLASVTKTGYLWTGQYSAYRGRKHGLKPNTTDGAKFVISAQNHDQVGNRMVGDRLSTFVSPEKARLAAAAIVLAPFLPMLFMGEEYGEPAPFQYFTSHSDNDLIEAVRKGRREEFDDFAWAGEAPDPHDEETFTRSRLTRKENAALRALYKQLLTIRRTTPALRSLDLTAVETHADDERQVMLVHRAGILVAYNFSESAQEIAIPFQATKWLPLMETGARVEGDIIHLAPTSFAVMKS